MLALSAESANALFVAGCEAVLSCGQRVAPRGMSTVELMGVHLRLTDPRRRFICLPPVRVLNPAFAAAETAWILSGSDEDWIHTYNARLAEFADGGVLQGAYGPRLRRWAGNVDQLDHVRRLLIADPDSRRAVIQLYDPARDHEGHKDVPCTLGHRFYLRRGRLHMHTTMRSQDLWLGFCYDLFAATVLHELMAGWLDVPLGEYHHHVDSLHLYAEHVGLAHDLPRPPVTSPVMAPLSVDWDSFDRVMAGVIAGEDLADAGWRGFAEVMRSYRIWKARDHDDARDVARQSSGQLACALEGWYDHLATAAVPAGRRG